MENVQTNQTSAFQYAIKTGILIGLLGCAIQQILFFLNQMENGYVGLIVFIIMFTIFFFLIKNFRDKHSGGYITFGAAFSLSLQIVIYCSIILAVYNFIFRQVSPATQELMMKHQEQKLMAKGMSDDDVETAMKMGRKFGTPLISSIVLFFSSTLIWTVVALIIAAICKKERPVFSEA